MTPSCLLKKERELPGRFIIIFGGFYSFLLISPNILACLSDERWNSVIK